jgi:hypothetical protein
LKVASGAVSRLVDPPTRKGLQMSHSEIHRAVRDGVMRGVAVVGLAGVALIHLVDTPSKFSEVPYMGWMYVGLIAACLVVAGLLIRHGDRRAWLATLALPAMVLTGFVLSRTTGLPQASGDIGNWGEPLGIASMFVEGALIALAGGVLAEHFALVPARRVQTASQS